MDIGQAEIAAGMAEGKVLVIEPKQMQKRGVKIVDMHLLVHCGETKLIGRSMDIPAFHPAACQPDCEAVMVVVAPIDLAGV